MPKRDPKTATGEKRKASSGDRLACLLAEAIAGNDDLLAEISDLLPRKKQKPDGTELSETLSAISDTSDLALNEQLDIDISSDPSEAACDLTDEVQAQPDPLLLGSFSAIHAPLDQSMKKKILSREYVDFSSLYFSNSHVNETTMIQKTQHMTTKTVHKNTTKQITSILTWCRAFQMYADIYCLKYPEEASQMFRYMSLVQNLAKHTTNWQLYDEKFRRLRAISPLPWGAIHTETFLYCTISQPSPSSSGNFRPKHAAPTRFPKHIMQRPGYCWDFQKHNNCFRQRCTVLHQCANCEGGHGAQRCGKPLFRPTASTNGSPQVPSKPPHSQTSRKEK